MLESIEVTTARGTLMPLYLGDVVSGLVVVDVGGVDPVKANIVSSSFSGSDGSQYQSVRRENRNITIQVELHPDYVTTSVRDLRNQLYDFFMPKSMIGLKFYDSSGFAVDISGMVETCETALFTQEPAVDISIICFDPDFIHPTPGGMNGMSTAGSNETLISYTGTVETGIQFVFSVDRPLTEFTIYHRPPDGTLRSMDIAGSFVAGDVLTISTVSGDKRATLTRAGSDSSVLRLISPQSNWIELTRGDNYIRVYAEGVGVPYEITYTNRYGGL